MSIATGGGAVLRESNRRLLTAGGFVVWLTAAPEALWARVQADPATAARRPNLTAAGGLEPDQMVRVRPLPGVARVGNAGVRHENTVRRASLTAGRLQGRRDQHRRSDEQNGNRSLQRGLLSR